MQDATQQDALVDQILHQKIQVGASFIKRIGARLIDQCIFVVFVLILYFSILPFNNDKDEVSLIVLVVALVAHAIFYLPYFETRGGTPGKKALSLKSVSYQNSNFGGNPSIDQAFKRAIVIHWPVIAMILLALYYKMTKIPYVEPPHGLDAIYFSDPTRDARLKQISTFNSLFELFRSVYILMLALVIPLSVLNKYRLGWHDRYSKISVISNKTKVPQLDIATMPGRSSRLPAFRFSNKIKIPKIKLRMNTAIFTSKIAYLVYIVLAILILMYAKYKLDIMKEENRYELKEKYRKDYYY